MQSEKNIIIFHDMFLPEDKIDNGKQALQLVLQKLALITCSTGVGHFLRVALNEISPLENTGEDIDFAEKIKFDFLEF